MATLVAVVAATAPGCDDTEPVSVVLSTDLNEEGDLDDHFDLAMAYSGALAAPVELIHVDAGWPPEATHPAYATIERLEAAYGTTIDVVEGSRVAFEPDAAPPTAVTDALATRIRDLAPVALVITGTARDVAWTFREHPDLLDPEIIRSVWILAGNADLELPPGTPAEANALGEPAALAAVFEARLPTVWIPPFDGVGWANDGGGSWYVTSVGRLFEGVDPDVQRAMALAWHRDFSGSARPTAAQVAAFRQGTKSLYLSGLLTLLDPATGGLSGIDGVVGTEPVSVEVDPASGLLRPGPVEVQRILVEDLDAYAGEMVARHRDAMAGRTPPAADVARSAPALSDPRPAPSRSVPPAQLPSAATRSS